MNQNLIKHSPIQKEFEMNRMPDYRLGSYLYMGMARKKGKKVCISVAYTLIYCFKKADEFLKLDPELSFYHVSKIQVGQKVACEKFYPEEPLSDYYK